MTSPTSISSGLLTADTQVYTGRGILSGVLLVDLDSEVTVYDGTSASGTVLFSGEAASETSSQEYDLGRVRCLEGLFVEVTSGSCIVYFGA